MATTLLSVPHKVIVAPKVMISLISQPLLNIHQMCLVDFILTVVAFSQVGMIVRMVIIYSKCDILYDIDM